MKMNNIFVKLLVSLLIVLTLANFIGASNMSMNYCFADSTEGEERTNSLLGGLLSNLADSIVNAVKGFFLSIFRAARSINYKLASAAGTVGGVQQGEISPFDIFFNKFTLLDANIFSTTDRDGNAIDPDSIVYKIRTNAAIWYYAIRTLAISVIAIMLLWNLIRALSKNTSAEQKSVAKSALGDWVLSFALVMFMHIIVIVVLNFNDLLLKGIESFTPLSNTSDFFDALENAVFNPSLVLSIAALIVYALLNWQTLKYILIYIQRFLTIVLLVMISPIVPVTYSTDRMKGGRGAALNGWLKELIFNIFIQTLHAVVYAALVGVAMSSLTSVNSVTGFDDLAPALIAVTAMLFVKYAERMVKSIFGFDGSQVLNNNVISQAVTNIGNFAGSAARTVNGAVQRSVAGGPMISFGKNVDGTHIGIGQAAQSVGRNLGQGLRNMPNTIRGTGNSFMEGLTGGNPNNSQNAIASAEAEANAIAEASAEATAENGADGQDGATVVATEVGGVFANEGQEDKDYRQDEKDKIFENELGNMSDELEDLSDKEKAENNLLAAVKSTTKNENNKTTQTTFEKNENIIEETTEEVVEGDNNVTPIAIGGGMNPDTVDELKQGIEAIKNNDIEKLEELATELNKQLEEIGSKLDIKTKNDIESNIEDLMNDPKALGKYINSLPEGSDERKYAEAFSRFSALMNVSDENITGQLSDEERSKILVDTYNAQGVDMPVEAENVNITPENNNGSKILNIKDRTVKQAQEALFKLGVDVKDETELKADFEARMEKMESSLNMKDPTMDDVIKSLDSQGKREYRDFKNGKLKLDNMQNKDAINAVALEREARALDMIERQAQKEGFKMTTESTNYEGTVTINGKKETFHSSTAEGVIKELQNSKNRNKVIDINDIKNNRKIG